jgi:hypothetical protein
VSRFKPLLTRLLIYLMVLAGLTACNLRAGPPPPPPTPTGPLIEFISPVNNDRFREGTDLTIALLAQDSEQGIARIELQINDRPYGEAIPETAGAVPIFAANLHWLAEGAGYHALTAIAFRPDGTASPPQTISILITPANDGE